MSTDRRKFLKVAAVTSGAFLLTDTRSSLAASLIRPDSGDAAPGKAAAPLNILILGGTGFTGPEQVNYALARGHKVTLFNRNKTRPDMLDRARDYRTAQIHDERMQSLGRLAAGFAHELNNPASGASSHARSLAALLDDLNAASRALARARLTDEQIDAVDAVRRMCYDACAPKSPLEAADREDEFADWLLAHVAPGCRRATHSVVGSSCVSALP